MSPKTIAWDLIGFLYNNVESKLSVEMQNKHGLGLSDFRALRLLAEAENHELRMQDLAKRLSLNQSSVTRLIERMERSGYTTRDFCPADRRGVYSVLSKKGLARLEKAEIDYESLLKETLRSVSPSFDFEKLSDYMVKTVKGRSKQVERVSAGK